MQAIDLKPELLVEPFAGGSIISLTALFEKLVEKVIMIELDSEVAAVWETVMEGHAEWLADRILGFDLTHDNLAKELKAPLLRLDKRLFKPYLKIERCMAVYWQKVRVY